MNGNGTDVFADDLILAYTVTLQTILTFYVGDSQMCCQEDTKSVVHIMIYTMYACVVTSWHRKGRTGTMRADNRLDCKEPTRCNQQQEMHSSFCIRVRRTMKKKNGPCKWS